MPQTQAKTERERHRERRDQNLALALQSKPRLSIDDVLESMDLLVAALNAEPDGIWWFTVMYRMVTRRVRTDLEQGQWQAPMWMHRLVVEFAELYFQAYILWVLDREQTPRGWRPLFEERFNPRVSPLQFGLAGLNAHINRDLFLAVRRTCGYCGVELMDGTPHASDYFRINEVLDEVEVEAMGVLADAGTKRRSAWLGGRDQRVVMRLIDVSRGRAWRHAQWYDALCLLPPADRMFLRVVDRSTEMLSLLLLRPVGFL